VSLYVVSARDELPALPGAADGGSIPLFAAESMDEEAAETVSADFLVELPLPQDIRISVIKPKKIPDIFFIKKIS
jgi:hypothetical protein